MLAAVSQHKLRQAERAKKELAERRIEALRLYEPLPWQERYHACRSKEAICVKGNQTGGSLAGFVEVARAITNQDPYDKYPKTGTAVCLGYGEKHIGRVIHRYLFRPGAFRIIRDMATKEWRTFRPWSPLMEVQGKYGDEGREKESKPAPPLIPQRFISGKIAWEKRSEHIFSYVRFTTDWELYAMNSAGEASQAQGFQVDLYHIDEDLATPGWYEEALGRTAIRKGLIRWTALPHVKTDDIVNMINRAIEQEDQGVEPEKRTTVRIHVTMYDNPYYPEESKRENERIWRSQGEDVYRKRALGEIVSDTMLMYPTFTRKIHDAISWDMAERTKIQELLTENGGEPLPDWTRYMAVDPGHTVCAVVFLATPPPYLGDYRIAYDELYLRNADKHVFANHVKPRTQGKVFQDFIIDAHGGNLRELGSGLLPKRQYEMEMESRGVTCQARGSRFCPGSDDIKGREEILRSWLALREDSTPKLYLVAKRCPNLVRELERFRKKTVKVAGQDVPTDDGNRKAAVHAVECLEYLAAHGCPYVKPRSTAKRWSVVQAILHSQRERAMQRAARGWRPGMGERTLGPKGAEV